MGLYRHLALCIALIVPLRAIAQPAPPPPAEASQPPSPEALQAQLRSWVVHRLGPHAAAELRVRVRPEDDRMRVAVAEPAIGGEAETTALLRPGGDGRWMIDAIRIPTATFTVTGQEGAGGPASFAFSVGAQDSHAVVDPTLTRASSLDLDLHDIGLTADGPGLHQAEHVGRLAVHARLAPDGNGLDFDQQTAVTGWHSASRMQGRLATIAADSVQATAHIGGLDHEHAEALLGAVAGVLFTLPAEAATAQGGAPPSPPARAVMLACIAAMQGAIADAHGAETVTGLHIGMPGQGEANVRQVRLAAELSAPDGLVRGWFDVGIDGLQASGLPPDQMALVPTHVALHPTIAGVRLTDLTTLMLAATQPDADPGRLRAEAEALLMHRGVVVGLESLTLNLGPATLYGHGRVTMTGHDTYDAEAHFAATGFDALMAQAAGDPALRRALPVLAIMRGFAQPQGDRLVWDVIERNGALTVNGIPLSAGDQPDKR